jgi:hypothetical protein
MIPSCASNINSMKFFCWILPCFVIIVLKMSLEIIVRNFYLGTIKTGILQLHARF